MWSVLIQVAAVGHLTLLSFSFYRFKNMAKTSCFWRNPGTCQPSLNLDKKKWSQNLAILKVHVCCGFNNVFSISSSCYFLSSLHTCSYPELKMGFCINAVHMNTSDVNQSDVPSNKLAEIRELLWGPTEAKMVPQVLEGMYVCSVPSRLLSIFQPWPRLRSGSLDDPQHS